MKSYTMNAAEVKRYNSEDESVTRDMFSDIMRKLGYKYNNQPDEDCTETMEIYHPEGYVAAVFYIAKK